VYRRRSHPPSAAPRIDRQGHGQGGEASGGRRHSVEVGGIEARTSYRQARVPGKRGVCPKNRLGVVGGLRPYG